MIAPGSHHAGEISRRDAFLKTKSGKSSGIAVPIQPATTQRMTSAEQTVLDTLLDLEAKVATIKTAQPKPNLMPIFDQLDALTRALPSSTHPDLLHYLHKRSYQKARLFLQGRDAENAEGNCGHV